MKNRQEDILKILFEYYGAHPGSPKMAFRDLCNELFENPSQVQITTVQGELYTLKRKGWASYDLTDSGSAGLIQIEPDGIRIAQELQRTKAPRPRDSSLGSPEKWLEEKTDKVKKVKVTPHSLTEPCPATLGDLIQRDPYCARLIQREEILREIKDYLTQTPEPKPNHIILYGQPMVGKTRILDRLSEALGGDYIPLMVTGQGLTTIDNLDAFAFDLADQLTNKFRKWTNQYEIPFDLDVPKWSNFKGKGSSAFFVYWDNLRQIAGHKQLVIIFDEVEHLLDMPQKLDPRILTFLDNFVRSPENGHFILAGSERIQRSGNENFSMLIAKGKPIRVRHYDDDTIVSVFSAIQKFFSFEDNTLQYCMSLCNGHPRLLQAVYEAVVHQVTKTPGKQELMQDDIEAILTSVIERTDEVLWALLQRLSIDEQAVVQLISWRFHNLLDELEYSLSELVERAERYQQITELNVNRQRLRRGVTDLAKREWVQWKSRAQGTFRFKLGVFPLWLHLNHINIQETHL